MTSNLQIETIENFAVQQKSTMEYSFSFHFEIQADQRH